MVSKNSLGTNFRPTEHYQIPLEGHIDIGNPRKVLIDNLFPDVQGRPQVSAENLTRLQRDTKIGKFWTFRPTWREIPNNPLLLDDLCKADSKAS